MMGQTRSVWVYWTLSSISGHSDIRSDNCAKTGTSAGVIITQSSLIDIRKDNRASRRLVDIIRLIRHTPIRLARRGIWGAAQRAGQGWRGMQGLGQAEYARCMPGNRAN